MGYILRMPHKSAKEAELAAHLTDVIEDNAKFDAELQEFPKFRNGTIGLLFGTDKREISELTSKEVKDLHQTLWDFYQKLVKWVAVASFLKIEVSNPETVQLYLDDAWYLLDTNPYTRIPWNRYRELSPEESSSYKKILIEYSNKQVRAGA